MMIFTDKADFTLDGVNKQIIYIWRDENPEVL